MLKGNNIIIIKNLKLKPKWFFKPELKPTFFLLNCLPGWLVDRVHLLADVDAAKVEGNVVRVGLRLRSLQSDL